MKKRDLREKTCIFIKGLMPVLIENCYISVCEMKPKLLRKHGGMDMMLKQRVFYPLNLAIFHLYPQFLYC